MALATPFARSPTAWALELSVPGSAMPSCRAPVLVWYMHVTQQCSDCSDRTALGRSPCHLGPCVTTFCAEIGPGTLQSDLQLPGRGRRTWPR